MIQRAKPQIRAVQTTLKARRAGILGVRLIDTNGDGVPDSREFAGSHRYNTAVMLAERFASDEGSISTVILASGESQVDAVTASGLAGNLNAPVLLTRSSRLPHNVARFIDEQNVTDVVIVGGTAAVSDDVVTALESLGSRPSVSRVSGADRYATAAAIGGELGGPNPTWCGSDQSAAILVNGGSEGRADAIAIGPMAFRLGLPMLLTSADEVPEATAAFLTDNKVERVVVVGGMGAVSAGVVDALVEDIGVVNVHRISGGSAAATSVMVAKEMLGNCADVLQTNRDMVALVNRDATADGIAAAPVLGRGLGAAGSVPVLLVGDELPAAVSDYLASTAEARGGQKTHQRIVAIGGTAVVSNSVMTDAVAAAKTSSALTATITANINPATGLYETWSTTDGAVGGGVFRVTFSDDVRLPVDPSTPPDGLQASEVDDPSEVRGTVLDPTLYRVNGRRVEALTATTDNPRNALRPTSGTGVELIGYRDLVFVEDRTVTVYVSHVLEPNDTISVDPSLIERSGERIGANGDRRPLESEPLTLGPVSPPVDRSAPLVEVIAVPGHNYFDVIVTEPTVTILHDEFATNTDLDQFVSVTAAPRQAAVTVDSVVAAPNAPVTSVGRDDAHRRYRVTVSRTLVVGDEITVQRGAVIDTGGRRSALVRPTVKAIKNNIAVGTTGTDGAGNANVAGTGLFMIESVSIGDYAHGTGTGTVHASADIAFGGADLLTVTAKGTGVASGARGNSWVIYGYDDRPDTGVGTGVQNDNVFEIDVDVDTANQRISYTISEAKPPRLLPSGVTGPTLGDLAAALVRNSDFTANFSVAYSAPTTQFKGSPLTGTDPSGEQFGDTAEGETRGLTSVGVVVKFNDYVESLTNTAAGGGITAAIATTLAEDIAPNFNTATNVSVAPDVLEVQFQAPDNQVHISYTSDSMAQLPTRAGFRVIAQGVADNYNPDGTTATADDNVREILNSLRPDSRIKP